MKKSTVVKNSLYKWYSDNMKKIAKGEIPNKGDFDESFGIFAQSAVAIKKQGFINVENFVGSAHIFITPINANEIEVKIFNVTSLTSGDLLKHIPGFSYPNSIVRDPNKKSPQPYSNISQTYSFTMKIDEIFPSDILKEGYKAFKEVNKYYEKIEK